jgi:hypothetical protein
MSDLDFTPVQSILDRLQLSTLERSIRIAILEAYQQGCIDTCDRLAANRHQAALALLLPTVDAPKVTA